MVEFQHHRCRYIHYFLNLWLKTQALLQSSHIANVQKYSHICNCILALLLASCFASCTCFSFFACLFRGLIKAWQTSAVAFGETWRLNHHPVRLFLCNLVLDGLSWAVFSGTLPCPCQTLNLASVLLNKTRHPKRSVGPSLVRYF